MCIGDQLTLTCSTNGTALRWSVSNPRIVETGVGDQLMSSTGPERLGPFVTSLGVFTFSKTSISPLMSVLEIVNITADLNDTRVDCAYAEGMSTTAIIVFQNAISNLSIIETKEGCDAKNISLLLKLEWTKEDVMYNVTVLPTPPLMSTDNDQIRLTVYYNMFYDVTVTTLCGQTTKVIHYVKCDNPLSNLSSDVMVSGYTDPALVGTNVTIICPTVTGSNTTLVITCMEDGLWEPDPRNIWLECADTRIHDCGAPVATSSIIFMYNSTHEGSLLKYSCSNGLVPSDLVTSVCTRSMNWYPDPYNHTCSTLSTGSRTYLSESTAIIIISFLVITVVVFFVIGFLCGCFCLKYKNSLIMKASLSTSNRTEHSSNQETQELEMMENVAYGPLPATRSNH